MIYYFAFGSNMNIERLETARLRPEGLRVHEVVGGRLDDYRVCFDKTASSLILGGVTNIQPSPGECVYGTLNQVNQAALDILDRYEAVADNLYQRIKVRCQRSDGQWVDAVAYQAQPPFDSDARPCREYLGHLLAGQAYLPAEYFERLKTWPTVD